MPRINSSGWKSGDVRIWSGTLDDIPSGWELASEMVDRAPVGAGGEYSKGQQFGSDSAATSNTTLSNSQIASHGHGYTTSNSSSYSSAGYLQRSASSTNVVGSTANNGGSQAHNHGNIDTRQKSIAVIWIRKL